MATDSKDIKKECKEIYDEFKATLDSIKMTLNSFALIYFDALQNDEIYDSEIKQDDEKRFTQSFKKRMQRISKMQFATQKAKKELQTCLHLLRRTDKYKKMQKTQSYEPLTDSQLEREVLGEDLYNAIIQISKKK